MKLLIQYLILLFLLHNPHMSAANSVSGEPGNLPDLEHQQVLLRVEPGFTRIDLPEMILFLDYKNGGFYRYDTVNDSCFYYPLGGPAAKDNEDPAANITRERGKLFSEIEELSYDRKDDLLPVRRLMFGPLVMGLKTVKTPIFEKFGMDFKPGIADFQLDQNHEKLGELSEIAAYNEGYYKTLPLLRQVDVVGLIQTLGGIPVQMERKGLIIRYKYQLAERGKLRSSLPGNCLEAGK